MLEEPQPCIRPAEADHPAGRSSGRALPLVSSRAPPTARRPRLPYAPTLCLRRGRASAHRLYDDLPKHLPRVELRPGAPPALNADPAPVVACPRASASQHLRELLRDPGNTERRPRPASPQRPGARRSREPSPERPRHEGLDGGRRSRTQPSAGTCRRLLLHRDSSSSLSEHSDDARAARRLATDREKETAPLRGEAVAASVLFRPGLSP